MTIEAFGAIPVEAQYAQHNATALKIPLLEGAKRILGNITPVDFLTQSLQERKKVEGLVPAEIEVQRERAKRKLKLKTWLRRGIAAILVGGALMGQVKEGKATPFGDILDSPSPVPAEVLPDMEAIFINNSEWSPGRANVLPLSVENFTGVEDINSPNNPLPGIVLRSAENGGLQNATNVRDAKDLQDVLLPDRVIVGFYDPDTLQTTIHQFAEENNLDVNPLINEEMPIVAVNETDSQSKTPYSIGLADLIEPGQHVKTEELVSLLRENHDFGEDEEVLQWVADQFIKHPNGKMIVYNFGGARTVIDPAKEFVQTGDLEALQRGAVLGIGFRTDKENLANNTVNE
jgi:hypothetical protein